MENRTGLGDEMGGRGDENQDSPNREDNRNSKAGPRGSDSKTDSGGNNSTPSKNRLHSESEPVDNEYYNFLHVSRNATAEEITAAYKKLSRLYHPDKHLDDEKKQKALVMFAKLKNSYEVLNDPHKRAIYDCLGKEGLQVQGWEIVQRTKTPQEIREEYERLAKARAERRLQQRTNPTSKLQMTINATDLFERYLYDEGLNDYIESSIPTLEVSEISFDQTIEVPITNADNVTLSGHVSTRDGTGSGAVGCSLRRITSDTAWQEISASFGQGPRFKADAYRKLSTHSFVNMSGSLQFKSMGITPAFNISLGNHLSKNTVGYLTYSTNWRVSEYNDAYELDQEQSGMSTMLVRNTEKFHFSVSLQFGIPYTYFMASVTRKFDSESNTEDSEDTSNENPKRPVKLRGSIKVGTFGAMMEYGIERRLTPHSNLAATMVVGIPFGVTLKIKFTRASQTYIFPIHLADEILMQPIFYGTVTPLLTWFTIQKLIIDPYKRKRKETEKQKLKETNLLRVAESRKDAIASIDLMLERYSRIRTEEVSRNGLIILAAVYGKIVDDITGNSLLEIDDILPSTLNEPNEINLEKEESQDTNKYIPLNLSGYSELVDVTVPVQCLVESGRLTFFDGSKADLAGFYDPCALLHDEQKHLLIRYSYQNASHQVLLPDEDALKVPKTAHRLSTGR